MAILRERHFSEYQFEKNFYQKIHFGKYRNLLSKNYVCFRILSFFETRRFLKNDIMFFDYFFFFCLNTAFLKIQFSRKNFSYSMILFWWEIFRKLFSHFLNDGFLKIISFFYSRRRITVLYRFVFVFSFTKKILIQLFFFGRLNFFSSILLVNLRKENGQFF